MSHNNKLPHEKKTEEKKERKKQMLTENVCFLDCLLHDLFQMGLP